MWPCGHSPGMKSGLEKRVQDPGSRGGTFLRVVLIDGGVFLQ